MEFGTRPWRAPWAIPIPTRLARVDWKKGYGCGICRNVCARDAITLADRSAVPEAASLWL